MQKFSDVEVLVWGEDGKNRVESLDKTSRGVEGKSRLEVLGRDVASSMRVFWALGLAVIGSRFAHMRLCLVEESSISKCKDCGRYIAVL